MVCVSVSVSLAAMAVTDVDFDDDRALVEKDRQIRRRYMQWFNKRQTDFDSNRAYDDYLEMVEDVIHNLVHSVDVEETIARVEKYREENADIISTNQALRVEEERLEAEEVVAAERARVRRLAEVRAEDERREQELLRKKRIEDAEELVRAAHGEEEYRRVVRKREKKELKERKKREAAEDAKAASQIMDTAPQWVRPVFPSALPTIVPDATPRERSDEVPDDDSPEAAAGGFERGVVEKRDKLEFEQSFALLDL